MPFIHLFFMCAPYNVKRSRSIINGKDFMFLLNGPHTPDTGSVDTASNSSGGGGNSAAEDEA